MTWLTSVIQAFTGADPLVVLAVVVLAIVYVAYRLAMRTLTTIERVSKGRSKP